jgi:uncharacterized membrane protein
MAVSGPALGLAISVFLACAVEAVEAMTIVLAVGHTRSWRSALGGVGGATVVLAALVVGLGPALIALPISVLRVAIGGLILVFGLQWLRKAILRGAGIKAQHDELEIYDEQVAAAREIGARPVGFDGYAFAVSFKGVLLEGLEVAFIVVTLGANQHRVGLAAGAAAAAVILVGLTGFALRAPLARVPENAMKFVVAVLLTSFGIFWGAEGAGASWPSGELSLAGVVVLVLLLSVSLTALLRRNSGGIGPRAATLRRSANNDPGLGATRRLLVAVADFVVGDDWLCAFGVVVTLGLTAALTAAGVSAWWVTPVLVAAFLVVSVTRARPAPTSFE